jgi:uncharacterized membrane protein
MYITFMIIATILTVTMAVAYLTAAAKKLHRSDNFRLYLVTSSFAISCSISVVCMSPQGDITSLITLIFSFVALTCFAVDYFF